MQDIESCIRLVANFLNIAVDDELLAIVKQQSSKENMASEEHRRRFDEHPLKQRINERLGLPVTAGLDGNQVRCARWRSCS